ncbi:diguanylate cyclase domain-containing protein, partial [Mycobacterium avium]
HERLHHPIAIDDEMLSRTVSIGVAAGIPGDESTSDLLRRVDQATRSAKAAGGNNVATFRPEMSTIDTIRNDI